MCVCLRLSKSQHQAKLLCGFPGVKNADENELRSIASDPDEIHMYNVNDFKFLLDIVDDLSVNLCNSVKGSGGQHKWQLLLPKMSHILCFWPRLKEGGRARLVC